MTRAVWFLGAGVILAACASDPEETIGTSASPLTALCAVTVEGVGEREVEVDYLPHVVMCENGAASLEALKAQAVAARTYLYYSLKGAPGSIADGANAQVYSCNKEPTEEVMQAVAATSGEVLRYEGATICSFFVAGGKAEGPACIGSSAASTEKYVTYNEGLSGDSIHQSSLGSTNPKNKVNRGCMSQNGSDCLAKSGKGYREILRFYYGDDIAIERGEGACIAVNEDADSSTHAEEGDAGAPTDAESTSLAPVASLPPVEGGCSTSKGAHSEANFSLNALCAAIGIFAFRKDRRRRGSRV